MNNWLPIETAPKDGTVIQLWHKVHKCPVAAYYMDVEDGPWYEKTMTTHWPKASFTHWMPIVSPND